MARTPNHRTFCMIRRYLYIVRSIVYSNCDVRQELGVIFIHMFFQVGDLLSENLHVVALLITKRLDVLSHLLLISLQMVEVHIDLHNFYLNRLQTLF